MAGVDRDDLRARLGCPGGRCVRCGLENAAMCRGHRDVLDGRHHPDEADQFDAGAVAFRTSVDCPFTSPSASMIGVNEAPRRLIENSDRDFACFFGARQRILRGSSL
ncbi:hypothetical protein [Paracoccus mutanolyticus]|uniref:hypothetical protein n=1 Tax=Paracoccus mutanolyticus TaxID=1499308 RepID=UPI00167A18FE|nr:hypothetical protein [Paracoccus mutanolyticus]